MADVWRGYGDFAAETATGVFNMVRHPVQTGKAVAHAVAHPIETGKAVVQGVKDTGSALVSGDNRAAGKAFAGVLSTAVPASKASLVAKLPGKVVTKVTSKVGTKVLESKTVRKVVSKGQRRAHVRSNAQAGARREAYVQGKLEGKFDNASVQREHYLRDSNGAIAKDPITGKGRRVDHVVIENNQVRYIVETTSKKANKRSQLAKEARIRSDGGVYIRDRNTLELLDVSNIRTRLSRRR